MRNINEEALFFKLRDATDCTSICPQECRALVAYNAGYSRKHAAKIMSIKENTYADYLKQVRKKFNIKTRAELRMLEAALVSKGRRMRAFEISTPSFEGVAKQGVCDNSDQVS